jgi:predicted DNA-binding mobile mystery protein A
MRPNMRPLARSALDRRFKDIKTDVFVPAPGSWIKAIREALGMTTRQFAQRLGVSQPRVIVLEKAEQKRTITLDSLQRAARALDCDLVYALVPRKPLEKMVADQALKAAIRLTAPARHTMALEAQENGKREEEEQIRRLAQDMIAKAGTAIWDVE